MKETAGATTREPQHLFNECQPAPLLLGANTSLITASCLLGFVKHLF